MLTTKTDLQPDPNPTRERVRSLLGVAALVIGAFPAWGFVCLASLSAAGHGTGTKLMVAMCIAWGTALLFSFGVVVVGQRLLWKGMPSGPWRVVALVLLAALQVFILGFEVFLVFVFSNR